jgi:hypothetical protein
MVGVMVSKQEHFQNAISVFLCAIAVFRIKAEEYVKTGIGLS